MLKSAKDTLLSMMSIEYLQLFNTKSFTIIFWHENLKKHEWFLKFCWWLSCKYFLLATICELNEYPLLIWRPGSYINVLSKFRLGHGFPLADGTAWYCLRPATLLKKSLWHRRFPVNFANFKEYLFLFYRTLWEELVYKYRRLLLHL